VPSENLSRRGKRFRNLTEPAWLAERRSLHQTICDVPFRARRKCADRCSCWRVGGICNRVRNCCYGSYGSQAKSPAKKGQASKTAEKLRPEEIAPKRVNARYFVATNA